MSDPKAAVFDNVYVDSTAPTMVADEKIDGISDLSISRSKDMVDRNYLNGGGYKNRKGTLKDWSMDMSGHFMDGDEPQTALRASFETDVDVYVTVITDAEAAAGSQGFQYKGVVDSYDEKRTAAGVVEFSCKILCRAAPLAI
ncbi:phage tail tube protein [Cystobacter fuscus]